MAATEESARTGADGGDEEVEAAFNETGDRDDEPRSIDDRADEDGDEEDAPPKPMQIPLVGTQETISSSFGGARPTSSEIRLLGGLMPIEGSFPKGETIWLMVEAKVTHVEGADVTDDWGAVTRTIRRHKSRMISVTRVEKPE